MDLSAYSTRFGGSIKGFDVEQYLPAKEARKLDLFIQYGLAASFQAVRDSGLEITDANRERIGVAMGSGIGGLTNIENSCKALIEQGLRRISPFFVPGSIINMVSGFLSIHLGLQGPNYAIATACTTGTHCIGMAARNIAYGEADVMVAGGSEMAACGLGIGGFAAARALSTRNDDPAAASRPWDKGATDLCCPMVPVRWCSRSSSMPARGARIYAELIGFGMSADAFHMTSPPDDGAGAARCIRNALNDAQLNVEQVQYINAHGTSTPAGDKAEAAAIRSVFGDHAYELSVSSTKSMVGHLLGAAGAVEAIFSVLAIQDQVAPPTINLEEPDEGCDLTSCRTRPSRGRSMWSSPTRVGSAEPTVRLCSAGSPSDVELVERAARRWTARSRSRTGLWRRVVRNDPRDGRPGASAERHVQRQPKARNARHSSTSMSCALSCCSSARRSARASPS